MITSCPREIRSVPSASGDEHRVPAGVVGDREDVDPRVRGERPCASASTLAPPSAVIGPRLVTSSAATTKPPGLRERSRSETTAQPSPSTSGVPYVWKLSIVFTPQYWPRARSCAVHVIGSKSGS